MVALTVTFGLGFWKADGEKLVTAIIGLLLLAPFGVILLRSGLAPSALRVLIGVWMWWSAAITLIAAAFVAFKPVSLAFKFGFPGMFLAGSLGVGWLVLRLAQFLRRQRAAN
ncbi:MAG TPA: hypothetical protein VL284_10885 [Thermoanaerobaculia bacterium]|nr:hypothetical protein [Thermoanaerobaculia bacterium]